MYSLIYTSKVAKRLLSLVTDDFDSSGRTLRLAAAEAMADGSAHPHLRVSRQPHSTLSLAADAAPNLPLPSGLQSAATAVA